MRLENIIQNLKLVANLVENQSTGTPNDLANRLGVTDRTIRNYIKLLRGMGGDIAYSLSFQTYYLKTPAIFRFGFEPIAYIDEE